MRLGIEVVFELEQQVEGLAADTVLNLVVEDEIRVVESGVEVGHALGIHKG
jgi:hypothetical protein